MKQKNKNSVLYLSTFPPRECGIATFTKDLADAVTKRLPPAFETRIYAINNDPTDMYNYDASVMGHISATRIEDFVLAAERLNAETNVKLVHVQHEFGIFGGTWGNHLIPFLQIIKKPVVITFHSVLPRPNQSLKSLVQFIGEHVNHVVVMNALSERVLEKDYGIDRSKISFIPHGIPSVPFGEDSEAKTFMGFEGKFILCTFGHLNRGKGIEYAIRALPRIVTRYPNILYVVIGATHPVVRKRDGEEYRNFLKKEAERLNLKNHVKFYNKYLGLEEIISCLQATDVYLSPTLDPAQSVSGTLSYALGAGCPVISSASLYAKHLLGGGRGILVPPRDSRAIQKALFTFLQNPRKRKKMAKDAYDGTRHMTWPNVALSHIHLYRTHAGLRKKETLPPFTISHLERLTNDFGVVQFAKRTRPDLRSGYSLDDNARALMIGVSEWKRSQTKKAMNLMERYLTFLEFVQQPSGRFVNIVSEERILDKKDLSFDAEGRAVWALGFLLGTNALPEVIERRAAILFRKALPRIRAARSLRAKAFILLGISHYLSLHPSPKYKTLLRKIADSLVRSFERASSPDWQWFEDMLSYSNGKLPEALLAAYRITGTRTYLEAAEKNLAFLIKVSFEPDCLSPVGQRGWYQRSGKRARFDQQPEEVSSLIEALALAYRITQKKAYRKRAKEAFQWFLGRNHLNQVVYDEATGGCHDGIGKNSLNMNQGAESTISYLLARLSIEECMKGPNL